MHEQITWQRVIAGILILCTFAALLMVVTIRIADAENRAAEWERRYEVLQDLVSRYERIIAEMISEGVGE